MAVSEHEAKMVKLQYDMRNNQKDLSEFLSDMTGWEEEMKQKEQQLTTKTIIKENDLPPVRNSLHQKKKKKKIKEKEENSTKSKPKKISGYDFRAWDKLDVEKLCEEIDQHEEEGKKSESSEYETDEEWEIERKKQQALMEKDRGNECFKTGDYPNAIEAYTKGMALDPTNPLLPANRAMALLKQDKYAAAELDCVTALTLDPLYVKAYLRRGSARFGLKKYPEAKEDFEKVLKLEPQNKKAKLEIDKIEKELSKEKMVAQTDSLTDPDAGVVHPITKAPQERSKKPLRRIEIEEVGLDDDEQRKSAVAKLIESQSDAKKQMTQRDNQMFEHFTTVSASQEGQSPEDKPVFDKNRIQNITENQNGRLEKDVVRSDVYEKDKSAPSPASRKPETISTSQNVTSSKSKTVEGNLNLKSKSNKNHSEESPSLSPRNFEVPQTSFQFQKDYKVLRNNLEAFYNYVKRIDTKQYPKLFGEAMDAEILMKMLTVFKDFYISAGEDFYPHLCSLAQVKRFSMTVMFLSRKDQQVLKELFEHLRNKGEIDNSELDKWAKLYELR